MTLTAYLPHDLVVNALRTSNIPPFSWGEMPYYEEVQEGQYQFPFCTYFFPESEPQLSTEDGYAEMWDFEVVVVSQVPPLGAGGFDISTLSSPSGDPTKSVIAYMDSFMRNPWALAPGATPVQQSPTVSFTVNGLIRKSYAITREEMRGPNTMRVYKAKATYRMQTSATIPPS